MLNKTTWFSVIAAAAVLGSMAAPMIASAHEGGDGAAATATGAAKPEGKHQPLLGSHLATALGITPEALAAAVKAARAAVPALTDEQKADPAAREAHAAAIEAAMAEELGITVDALNAAQATVKAEVEAKKGERRAAAEDKAEAHFAKLLDRLVGAGIITQAHADEALAQFKQGGEARASVVARLRALLQQEHQEKRTAKPDEKKKGEQREQKRPGIERLRAQHPAKQR